jgi:23S rRNA (pseudouridine1915-N3)-methyltransferase
MSTRPPRRGKIQLRIIWVGKTAKGFAADAVQHYRNRIAPFAGLECVEVRAAAHSGRDTAQAVKREAAAILRLLGAGDHIALLHERGREFSSPEFAAWIAARQSLTMIIGGAYGVDRTIAARAEQRISLSRLTLPHQLVRVVLLEQIYRAMTILHGHGYHHA